MELFNLLKRKLKSNKGAMDKVIVTLILAIIAVIGIVGIEKWSTDNKNELIIKADNTISNILTETNSN